MPRKAIFFRFMTSAAVAAASLMAGLAAPAGARAAVIYVSKDGKSTNDGRSWATAKLTIVAGVSSAVAGDEVWVAFGTYNERVRLKAGVALYGGFAGMETELAQRNWVANPTILDGSAGGSVVTSPPWATAATRIDGFVLSNGTGTLNDSGRYGGAVYCLASSPTIANNTITGNIATYGCIYCGSSSSPTIINNTITGNSASYGGAICCTSSSPTITNNTITGNIATYGGIYCGSSSSPAIINNTITRNDVIYGGGIYCDSSSPTITNNTIAGNITSEGGGVYCAKSSSPRIANNTVKGNSGSGIYCDASSPTIANNAIAGNSATHGGGIYCTDSSPMIANNTIMGNTASSTGGGVSCHSSSPTITNTILAFNSSGIARSGLGTLTLRYNCVFGNTAYDYAVGIPDPTGTNGNIKQDPKLADPAYGNAHIQPDSPCIDAGNDADVQPTWLDLDGQSRTQGGHADIGADEFDGTISPAGPYVVVRVSPSGSDAGDGQSWATAKRTVQAGVNAAFAQGGDVWVAAGTYPERITLHAYTHLYGGFAGSETQRNKRDWTANVTTLDGQAGGSVVTVRTGDRSGTIDGFTIRNGMGTVSASATYGGGIYCASGAPTIANNIIKENSATCGGGIYGSSYSMIANNTIALNSAYSGGGIYASSPLIIANNSLVGNSADSGGGIYSPSTLPTIVNTIVAFNSSGMYQAGLGVPPLRHNCVFGNRLYDYSGLADPTGSDGNIKQDPRLAGVNSKNLHIQPDSPCVDAGSDPDAQVGWVDLDRQPRFQGEHVDIGVDESDGTIWPAVQPVIVRVSPAGKDANDGHSWAAAKHTVQAGIDAASVAGGEVWVAAGTYSERVVLHPYVYLYGGFAGNEARRDDRNWACHPSILDGRAGGSVVTIRAGDRVGTVDGFTIRNGQASSGGGIECSASPTIANNTIAGNTATDSGGGIHCSSGSPMIVNNTVAGNGASVGGGVYCARGSEVLTNNTITANSASAGGGIYCLSASVIANTIVAFNTSGVYIDNCAPKFRSNCVFGNSSYDYASTDDDVTVTRDPTGADGNIKQDPRLAGWGHGNVHLQPDSPCIDSGHDADVRADWLDLDGQPRTQGTHVDIGADESDGTAWSAGPYIVVRVSPSGDDANDGLSWSSAKRTVQAAIDAASSLGGEVWVAAGTYPARITVPIYTYIYGGFAGSESQRDGRNWVANLTTLDGRAGGSVVTITAGGGVSAIDGFTIRNGVGTASDSGLRGGGIYCSFSAPSIANNTITANTAAHGGGIQCYYASPVIASNTVTGNTATGASSSSGGGIACHASSPTITNSVVAENAAATGGGVYCIDGAPVVVNSTFTRNNATGCGGGIFCEVSGLTVAGSVLAGNTAGYGGGIFCGFFAHPVITNSTLTANIATNAGAIYCDDRSLVTITNSLVAFNSSGILRTGTLGTATLRYNCVFGNTAYNYSGLTDPTGSKGNISADPRFMSVYAGIDGKWGTADDVFSDLRLKPDSPCIDAGNHADVPKDILTDLTGAPRFVDSPDTRDTGSGTPPIVDMGAYEYQPSPPADFDRDGDVDDVDLGVFDACATGWEIPFVPADMPDCPLTPDREGHIAADFDKDGDVDLADFGVFQRCISGFHFPADPNCGK